MISSLQIHEMELNEDELVKKDKYLALKLGVESGKTSSTLKAWKP